MAQGPKVASIPESRIAAAPYGKSTILHFARKEYGGSDQIWGMAQDSQGFMLALDGQALHQYDGVSWQTFELPFTARALWIDAQDRIYLGGYKEFGYAEIRGSSIHLTSISDLLPGEAPAAESVHSILPFEQGVLFGAENGLYFLTEDHRLEILVQREAPSFHHAFVWQERVYVSDAREGLLVLRDVGARNTPRHELVQVVGADSLESAVPAALIPNDEVSAWVLMNDRGSFRLTEDGLEAFSLPADSFLKGQRVRHGIRSSDGRSFVATQRGGVAVLDVHGKLIEVLDRDNHRLLNYSTYHLLEDRQGNIWISTDFGIAVVLRFPTRQVVDPSDVEGTLHRTYRHLGRLYFATRTSLYRQASAGNSAAPKLSLEEVPGIDSGTWSLLTVGEDLLAGTLEGIVVIRNAETDLQVESICPPMAVELFPSRLFPDRVFAGAQDGVRTLYRRSGVWTCSEPIPGTPSFMRGLAETSQGTLLILGVNGELTYLTFPSGIDQPPVATTHEAPRGYNELLTFEDEILLANSEQGLFRYQELQSLDTFPFILDASLTERLLPERTQEQVLIRYEEDRGILWSVRGNDLQMARRSSSTGSFEPPHSLAPDQIIYWCDIYRDPEQELYWMTASNGVYAVDPIDQRIGPPKQTLLRRVLQVRSGMDLLSAESESGDVPNVLAYRDNSLQFDFAAPIFDQLEDSDYQWKLEGFDDDWSAWSPKTSKEYTNLRERTYRFRVRARDRWGERSQEASFSFQVKPPAYRTSWAYGLYALGCFALLAAALEIHRKIVDRERAINQRLREVDQLKDEFLANTSHELRTPLYGMTGLAESLLDGAAGELPEPARGHLSLLVQSGRRLSILVDDILDFSKLERHSLDLALAPVELRALTDIVLTLSAPLAEEKGLQLINAVGTTLPPARADSNRLQQVLHNLVGNAIKYTDSGTVKVSADLRDGDLEVSVSDTGIGIAGEQLQRIFDPFVQTDASIRRQQGGTGLGLAVSRQLIELHGGTLFAESVLGEGSVFTFTVVASTDGVQGDPALPEEASRLGETTSPLIVEAPRIGQLAQDAPERGATILAVDDEVLVRQVLENHLVPEGYRVLTASSGSEALEILEEQSADLVLLDVMMPKMSGYEVCRALRQRRAVEALPVLFLSAMNRTEDRIAALESGGNDYIAKPIAKTELITRVRIHLQVLDAYRQQTEEVAILRGLLPICVRCKKIRDDEGLWDQMESYISRHSEAEFTHGICPKCLADTISEFTARG